LEEALDLSFDRLLMMMMILMYEQCILYSLLSTSTNALHISINNILYTVSTATRVNTPASSAGSLNYVLC
jgi:hypothetical protein